MTVEACAEIVRRGDPLRFLATMAAPPQVRKKLFPLYAMNVEVSRAPWVTSEPLIAEMRLQWWLDALEEIASQQTVRSHEVTTPLAKVLSAGQARDLLPLVEARKWDIGRDGFADNQSLFRHISRTSVNLAQVAASILGATNDAANAIGFAQGAAAWLQAVPFLVASGRKPLPEGETSAAALSAQGLNYLERVRLSDIPKSARPAWWVAYEARTILNRAKNDPSRVLTGTLALSEFRRRLALFKVVWFNRL